MYLSTLFDRLFHLLKSKFILGASVVIIAFICLPEYFEGTKTTFLTGLAALVMACQGPPPENKKRYGIAALAMLALTFLVPVKTFLFLALAFAVFYWVELYYVSMGFLGLAALLLSSPAFQYAITVFSFPIRLQLATAVGYLFSLGSAAIQIKGNTIFYKGNEFAVDPACMGLHMLSISLLLGIALIGLLQKKTGRVLGWKGVILYLFCLFILNVFSNLTRMVLLVQFAILPENFLHDVIGLVCLLLYVCVPAAFLAKMFVSKARTEPQPAGEKAQNYSPALSWLIIAGLVLIAFQVHTADTYLQFKDRYKRTIANYTSSLYAPGIVKLENKNALIYAKFIRGFYDTEHNPTICWRGSGYEFKEIKKEKVGMQEIYTAILCKSHEKLYTAWWYSNGSKSTTEQWQWRWDMLKGATDYAVINLTSACRETLINEIKSLTSHQTLAPLFNHL